MSRLAIRFLTTLTLLLASSGLTAAPTGGDIVIKARSATLDQKEGRALYQGKAELHQGNRLLKADKIELVSKNGEPSRVVATGSPLTLTDGVELDARANKLVYDIKSQQIQLIDNAWVRHQGREFEGATLIYDIQARSVKASGGASADDRIRLVIPETEQKVMP